MTTEGRLPPGLAPMTQSQRDELVRMYGEDVVRQSEERCLGKGYGAKAIACEEIFTRSSL